MVGNAIGDAFGGVVEFRSAQDVETIAGKPWDFGTHPVGVWEPGPPRGTGTDDLRNNQIFAECVIRNGGAINSQFLAMEYIQRYREPEAFYPKYHDLARKHFRSMYERSCAHLGMQELPSGRPPWTTVGRGFPTLMGLISLAPAGLLYRGEPEKAYAKTFELAFLDIGYARDATAMMGAMVSAALGGNVSGRDLVKTGLETDPFDFGKHRIMVERVERFVGLAEEAPDDQSLIDALAKEVGSLHPYDPIDVLGVPMAAIHHCDGDALRSIVMSANDRNLDADGGFTGLRDVDCVAGVAGAIVGALHGVEAFPDDWVSDTISANKDVYGIDLEANARGFCESVYGGT
jgi:ADP-ribosylglycohydrolase